MQPERSHAPDALPLRPLMAVLDHLRDLAAFLRRRPEDSGVLADGDQHPVVIGRRVFRPDLEAFKRDLLPALMPCRHGHRAAPDCLQRLVSQVLPAVQMEVIQALPSRLSPGSQHRHQQRLVLPRRIPQVHLRRPRAFRPVEQHDARGSDERDELPRLLRVEGHLAGRRDPCSAGQISARLGRHTEDGAVRVEDRLTQPSHLLLPDLTGCTGQLAADCRRMPDCLADGSPAAHDARA